ncbi:H-type lectin domain-containing protein [Neobacillus sp. WH10]|uniref:H-type lectin domain-containing protein n=1 Tax=Neobacillus sp. WH10 TaxID=3047873 RepID=UPI0024C1DDEE|nr:H-type lectin domain-containing protein [Neobacillus sp. WH10]WHY76065.1 H-type lectin domain-containing protein [Neobacillus sp. WH10]
MFEKLVSFTKDVSDLPDSPAANQAAELKAQFDAAPNEVREYLNKLIDALKKTEDGDSGADNIGATAIAGLTGTTIQTLLESLKTHADKKVQGFASNLRIEQVYGQFFTNGNSSKSTASVNFVSAFESAPSVFLGDISQIQSYGNTLCFPVIRNVTKTGFQCDIQTAGGQNLGTPGSPANIFINFLIIGK